jgi:hypothetical protein
MKSGEKSGGRGSGDVDPAGLQPKPDPPCNVRFAAAEGRGGTIRNARAAPAESDPLSGLFCCQIRRGRCFWSERASAGRQPTADETTAPENFA